MKIRRKLLSSGTNMEGDATDKVTMVTIDKQASNGRENSYRNNNYSYGRNNRSQNNKQERRGENLNLKEKSRSEKMMNIKAKRKGRSYIRQIESNSTKIIKITRKITGPKIKVIERAPRIRE